MAMIMVVFVVKIHVFVVYGMVPIDTMHDTVHEYVVVVVVVAIVVAAVVAAVAVWFLLIFDFGEMGYNHFCIPIVERNIWGVN